MVKVIYNRNCVYQTAYHVVWCPKYRKQILVGKIAEYMHKLVYEICDKNNWLVLSMEIQPDHIHMFLTFSPAISVSTAVKILKGTIARKLFLKFPELKMNLWGGHLWAPSYYVGTAGNISAETIQCYIERSEHIKGRR